MAKLPGVSRAAPTPWSARAPIKRRSVRSDRTQERGEGEPGRPDLEHPAAAVAVTQRTSQQQEPRQGQGVGVGHPLQLADAGVEVAANGREGNADDGGIDAGHGRAEHGGGHHPTAPSRTVQQRGRAPLTIALQSAGARRPFRETVSTITALWASSPRPQRL